MRTLGKGVKTRGGRVVGGGFWGDIGSAFANFKPEGMPMSLNEAYHKELENRKQGKGFTDEIERLFDSDEVKAERIKKRDDAWNARMAEIKKNSPFPRNEEMEKMLGYGFFDVLDQHLQSRPLVRRGDGIFGDLFEDAVVEGGKKLYQFDKSHGSHLKEGVKSGLKNMFLNTLKGGNGIESATRFGRGHKGRGILDDIAKQYQQPQNKQPHNRFHVLPDVMPEYDKNDNISGWIEKERRSTGYYGRPAILGEGM
jgi:hypothetical protein